MKRLAPFLALLCLVLSALACDVDWGDTFRDPDPTATGFMFTFSGSGTHTFGWQEVAGTCDTQNEMELTIDYANEAILWSRGVDYWTPYPPSYLCTIIPSDLPYLVVLYGTYDNDSAEITWNACNGRGMGNGSGSAVISVNPTDDTFFTVSGDGYCDLLTILKTHTFHFTLSRESPQPGP